MPIYEYQCEKCDFCFEMLFPSTQDQHVTCPKCDTPHVKRLLSTACFGSGFSGCGPHTSGGFS